MTIRQQHLEVAGTGRTAATDRIDGDPTMTQQAMPLPYPRPLRRTDPENDIR
jgi:hypothetical protein